MSEVVRLLEQDGVGHIVFDRPPANAYDLAFHEQFAKAIEAADAHDKTHVVILRSDVPGFFCAGADIKAFAANSTDDNKKMVAAARKALAKIEASDKPYIACLEGHALGGGLEIAMACDIRLCEEGDYKLGLPEAKLGLLPGNGGSQRLPRIVGTSHAIALLASGESIGPEEALRIGLVDRLFRESEFKDRMTGFARAIAASAPLAVAASKRAIRDGMQLDLREALQLEANLVDELYETSDAREGFKAASENRRPDFKGR